ncbi:DUF4186 domain-containing protein [Longimicrobium sp.]|jgi:predicted Fe-S protein YdhL (DUF1289 family)|uniref:DUF4186 domain-containing protein n=1 Tax=Longimicrobium sp. TaxID=2029185 RepID=UPI002F950F34
MTQISPDPLDALFQALGRSTFRRRFRLRGADLAYLRAKGMETVLRHADEMIAARLAPAEPQNDGKQTPMRGHPVFVAQHATATCCRGCLVKWHRIPKGRALSDSERAHVVAVIERWIREQDATAPGSLDAAPHPDAQLGMDLG